MKGRVRGSQDFWAGLLFVLSGGIAAGVARQYRMGTLARMGPGYFPFILGCILFFLGIIIMLRSMSKKGAAIQPWKLRPFTVVLSSVFAFALLVQSLGLIAALLGLIAFTCLGWNEFRPREMLGLYLVLTFMAVGVFVYGLGLPFKLWPW